MTTKPFMRPLRPEQVFGFRFMCWTMDRCGYGFTMEEAYWAWDPYYSPTNPSIYYEYAPA